MNENYTFSITKVDKIINMLPKDKMDKIPQSVRNFFDNNAKKEMLENMYIPSNLLVDNLEDSTLKFLKVIDYYINDNNKRKL